MDKEDTGRNFSLASITAKWRSKGNAGKEDNKPSNMEESVVDEGESVDDESSSSIERWRKKNMAYTQKRDTKGNLKVNYSGSIGDTEDDSEGHIDNMDFHALQADADPLEEYQGLWYSLRKRMDILSMFVACGVILAVLLIVGGVLVYFFYDKFCPPQVAVSAPAAAVAARAAAGFRNASFYGEKCGCVTITTQVEITQVKCSDSGILKDVLLPNDVVQVGRCPEYIRGKPCNNRGGVCTQMMYFRDFAVESDDPANPVTFCSQMFPYYCMCS